MGFKQIQGRGLGLGLGSLVLGTVKTDLSTNWSEQRERHMAEAGQLDI